jgi:sugar O-acyltransferase (sialic acid O-acetyltransferase NeuD family)
MGAALPIAILGAGGHAQVIADALRCQPETMHIPLFFLDDDPSIHNSRRMEIPILGYLSDLARIPHQGVLVAIGSNKTRKIVADRLRQQEETFVTVIHPRATIADGVQIGAGSVIFAHAVVNTGSKIGEHVVLNTGCTVDHHNHIADFAHVAPGAHLGGDVTLGEGAFIGIGAIVMPQHRVGAWATVGAGSLAHRDVRAASTIVGVPGRPLTSKMIQESESGKALTEDSQESRLSR